MKNRKLLFAVIVCALVVTAVPVSRYYDETGNRRATTTDPAAGIAGDAADTGDRIVQQLYRKKQSGEFVTVTGKVIRVLADDTEGDRHQRFIIALDSGQTLLVSHNIDLAPRIDDLKPPDRVTLRGEYEWNEKGGVIHWTHHDPDNRTGGGWIEHNGNHYR